MAKKMIATQLSEEEITNIIDFLTEEEMKGIDSFLSQDQIALKKASIHFLSITRECQEKIKNIENMMLAQKKLRDVIRKDLKVTGKFLPEYETEEYRKNREELTNGLRSLEVEKIYQAAFEYHEQLNEILGQKVVTVIVLPNKQGEPELFPITKEEIFNNKILNYEETSKTARLSARFKVSSNQLKNAGINAINRDDLKINDNLNVSNLNATYKTVLERFDKYKRLVLWFFPNGWKHSKVSARGDIAEAYSMFFLKQSEYNFQSSNKEENIDYFMVLGVQEVDNVSGLLQGDVSSGQYEFAIKSADASYMSIQQMIPLAEEIVNNKSYSLKDLQAYKDKLAKKKAKLRNPIKEGIGEAVSDYINEIMGGNNLTK